MFSRGKLPFDDSELTEQASRLLEDDSVKDSHQLRALTTQCQELIAVTTPELQRRDMNGTGVVRASMPLDTMREEDGHNSDSMLGVISR